MSCRKYKNFKKICHKYNKQINALKHIGSISFGKEQGVLELKFLTKEQMSFSFGFQ